MKAGPFQCVLGMPEAGAARVHRLREDLLGATLDSKVHEFIDLERVCDGRSRRPLWDWSLSNGDRTVINQHNLLADEPKGCRAAPGAGAASGALALMRASSRRDGPPMNQNTTVQRCHQLRWRNAALRLPLQRRLLFPVVSVLVILTGGALLTRWTVDRADRQMREDLLAQARLSGHAS